MLPGGSSGGQQTLSATSCELKSTGATLASLSATPSTAKVGLISHGIGVKTSAEGTTSKCGQINPTNQVLTLKIPSTGPLAGKHFDFAELDIEINNKATINAAIYNNGSQVDANASTPAVDNLVLNCTSSPSSCGPRDSNNYRIRVPSAGAVQFDEIRLWSTGSSTALVSSSSIELEGSEAPYLPGGLGASLNTRDSVFHVVAAGPDLTVTKTAVTTPISVGDDVQFDITVSNASGAGTASNVGVSDTPPPTGLDWSIASQTASACSIVPGALSCTIPTLAGGSSYSVRITAPTAAAGTVTNDGVVVSIDGNQVATAGPRVGRGARPRPLGHQNSLP